MKWQFCQLTNITEIHYHISWTYEGKTTWESLPLNTIKLRPLIFEKDLIYHDTQKTYARYQVVEREKKLLDQSKYHILEWNQLFELDYNLNMMSEEELVNRWDEYMGTHLIGGRLNVFVDRDHLSKLVKLITLGPMVSSFKVDGGFQNNFDYLGDGKANFSTCHDLDLL